jgi:hypothetical protein
MRLFSSLLLAATLAATNMSFASAKTVTHTGTTVPLRRRNAGDA